MGPKTFTFTLGSAAIVALCLPSVALAEPKLELEARGELLFGEDRFGREIVGGPGLGVQLGYALDTYPFLVMPEISISAVGYPDELSFTVRGTGGFRFGFTTVVEPSVFVHGGYAAHLGDKEIAHTFAIDAGFSVDKRLGRATTLGGSLGYQGFIGDVDQHGLMGGFHVGFWFN